MIIFGKESSSFRWVFGNTLTVNFLSKLLFLPKHRNASENRTQNFLLLARSSITARFYWPQIPLTAFLTNELALLTMTDNHMNPYQRSKIYIDLCIRNKFQLRPNLVKNVSFIVQEQNKTKHSYNRVLMFPIKSSWFNFNYLLIFISNSNVLIKFIIPYLMTSRWTLSIWKRHYR